MYAVRYSVCVCPSVHARRCESARSPAWPSSRQVAHAPAGAKAEESTGCSMRAGMRYIMQGQSGVDSITVEECVERNAAEPEGVYSSGCAGGGMRGWEGAKGAAAAAAAVGASSLIRRALDDGDATWAGAQRRDRRATWARAAATWHDAAWRDGARRNTWREQPAAAAEAAGGAGPRPRACHRPILGRILRARAEIEPRAVIDDHESDVEVLMRVHVVRLRIYHRLRSRAIMRGISRELREPLQPSPGRISAIYLGAWLSVNSTVCTKSSHAPASGGGGAWRIVPSKMRESSNSIEKERAPRVGVFE